MRVSEIADEALEPWVGVMDAVDAERSASVAGWLDWKRQAAAATWLLAEEEGRALGAAFLIGGWHAPPGVAHADVRVPRGERRQGVGTRLLGEISARAGAAGYSELLAEVREDDAGSLAFAARHGFTEAGRESKLVLELAAVEPPDPAPPADVEIVTWAERPELARGLYEVALEANPDIPGGEEDEILPFEQWLAQDMQGLSDRPEGVFVALADGEVVGFAKFSFPTSQPGALYHDLTGVRRAWRGRGIAGALKRTQIAWAKRAGFERLLTGNEVRNEPIRRLNERHGYRIEPGVVTVRGPVVRAAR